MPNDCAILSKECEHSLPGDVEHSLSVKELRKYLEAGSKLSNPELEKELEEIATKPCKDITNSLAISFALVSRGKDETDAIRHGKNSCSTSHVNRMVEYARSGKSTSRADIKAAVDKLIGKGNAKKTRKEEKPHQTPGEDCRKQPPPSTPGEQVADVAKEPGSTQGVGIFAGLNAEMAEYFSGWSAQYEGVALQEISEKERQYQQEKNARELAEEELRKVKTENKELKSENTTMKEKFEEIRNLTKR
ncbi:expressed unknown protein [Seminavis robusta]|uniref:Uncharacterized protein n=1 Tax=Seminavis robusta TaxID=568900 RepID=A0A9N8EFF0_9STRA|nr:expressed unknown protein [Seminavis robusta]|eukprot:Sro1103_g241760.1 n/a (247) ;mRNA; r:35005-35911